MKNAFAVVLAAASLTVGLGVGYAAKSKSPGMTIIAGKPAKEAGLAALQEAERLAEGGSWELIGIARVYYLAGDKARAQAMLDKVLGGTEEASDWLRAGELYAEIGDNARAEQYFLKALAADPKHDTAQSEVGAWYVRNGQREKGEALWAKAFARNPDEFWHYVRAAEALLGVPASD